MKQYRAYCNTKDQNGHNHSWSSLYNTSNAADLALYNHRNSGKHTNDTSKYGIDEVRVQVTKISTVTLKRIK